MFRHKQSSIQQDLLDRRLFVSKLLVFYISPFKHNMLGIPAHKTPHRIQGRKCSSLVLEGPKPGLWTEVRPVQRHREWPPLPGRSSALVPARSGYPGPSQRAPQLSSGIFAILIFVAPIDPPPPQKIAIDRQRRKKTHLTSTDKKNN